MNCWLNSETTAVTQTVFPCCWGCNLVSQALLVDICRLSQLGKLAIWTETVMCGGEPFSFYSLWCRAAWPQPRAACFALWLTIVPARPFIQGPPSPSQLGELKAQCLARSPAPELRERYHLTASVQTGMSLLSQTCFAMFFVLYLFSLKVKNGAGAGEPREMPEENVTQMCMSDKEDFWKQSFTKREVWSTSCSSAFDRWVWKNRSCTPVVCPSLSETMSNWRITP